MLNRIVDFPLILKSLIKDNSLTQKRLASLLAIPEFKMSDYVRRIQEPSIEDLVKLSNFFNISIDTLLGQNKHFNKYLINSLYMKEVIILPIDVLDYIIAKKEVWVYADSTPYEIININLFNKTIELKHRTLKFKDYGKIWTTTE